NMLAALLSGKALTASELANEAGVTAPTASAHLAKLEGGGLVSAVRQGRHRYFRLSGSDVAEMLAQMMGVAERAAHTSRRTGPSDPAMRKASVCYDHLAGEMGVQMFDALVKSRRLAVRGEDIQLTRSGETSLGDFGIDLAGISNPRRPLCKSCLDW